MIRSALPRKWLTQSITAIIQSPPENLEEIPERMLVGDDVILKVLVEGKKLGALNMAEEDA